MTKHTVSARWAAIAILLVSGLTSPASTQEIETAAGNATHRVSKRPVPNWVQEYSNEFATAVPTAAERRAIGGIWNLLVETQEDARSHTRFYRYARRFLTDEAVGEHADIAFSFDPNYEQLVFHTLRIHRDGEIIDQLPEQSFEIVRIEEESERQVYSGKLKAIAVVEGVHTGDVLEYSASIVGENPVFADVFASSYSASWSVPIKEARHRILLPLDPSGQRFAASVNGGGPLVRKMQDDHVEYLWEARDIPALVTEDEIPEWFIPYNWIEISDYPDWEAVATWAAKQYPISTDLPEALLNDITAMRELEGDEPKVLAALRYVQDKVRYVGMFSGVHSHRPYPLDLIVRRGFGDCKDKSLLLCSILHALGIDAVPALVNTSYRHVISEWPPSPNSFDHLITCVRLEGQRYWVDPTRQAQRGPLRAMYLPDYAKALIVETGTTDLTDIPKQGHAEKRIEVFEDFNFLDYAGDGELQIKTIYSGAEADRARNRFATKSHDHIQKSYVEYYSDFYENIEAVGEIDTKDDEAANQFTVTETYALSNLWSKTDEDDSDYRAADFEASTVSDALDPPDTTNRKMPYAIGHPINIKQVLNLHFPTDLRVDDSSVKVRNSAFEFNQTDTYSGTTLTSTFHYRSLTDHVTPEQIKKYAEDVDSAENNVAFWISIPERYTRGDYSLLAGLGFGENKHVVWIIAAILVGSAIGLIALIVGLMVYANRTSSPTPNQAPKTTPPPLPPTNR